MAPAATTVERVDQYVSFVNQAEKQALLTLMLRIGFSEKGVDGSRARSSPAPSMAPTAS